MKNNLFFIQDENLSKKARTERWYVYSSHSNCKIGVIAWYIPWRCYVLEQDDNTVWSHECLSEVIVKIISLEDKRKLNLKAELESEVGK
jgi:hypothetical protein